MTIGKLASESGIPASTMRYWEGLLYSQNRRASAGNDATRPMPSNISRFHAWRKRADFVSMKCAACCTASNPASAHLSSGRT